MHNEYKINQDISEYNNKFKKLLGLNKNPNTDNQNSNKKKFNQFNMIKLFIIQQLHF